MNTRSKLLVAAIAVSSIITPVFADPAATKVNPGVQRAPVTPVSEEVRRAVVKPAPAPAPTGPCMAELSMDRVEISQSADSLSYNVNVTITNIGTETATGWQTNAGAGLGIAVSSEHNWRAPNFSGQLADIASIPAGASQVFTGSIPASAIGRTTRQVTFTIDRGPDGPRCAYDARRNNDGLGMNGLTIRDWLAAGNSSYVRVR